MYVVDGRDNPIYYARGPRSAPPRRRLMFISRIKYLNISLEIVKHHFIGILCIDYVCTKYKCLGTYLILYIQDVVTWVKRV